MSKLKIYLQDHAELTLAQAKSLLTYNLAKISSKSDCVILTKNENISLDYIEKFLIKMPKQAVKFIMNNAYFYSPENILMFNASAGLTLWYLIHDLCNIIDKNPLRCRLKFAPKGLGNHLKEHYLWNVKNQCVVCGTNLHLEKHHVIPYCYRKFFEEETKRHNNYDILLLCKNHHKEYEQYACSKKDRICEWYGLKKEKDLLCINNMALARSKAIARSALKFYENIPDTKKRLFIDKFESITQIKFSMEACNYIMNQKYDENICKKIVCLLDTNEKMQDFTAGWRSHFVHCMKPKYLPDGWKVNARKYFLQKGK